MVHPLCDTKEGLGWQIPVHHLPIGRLGFKNFYKFLELLIKTTSSSETTSQPKILENSPFHSKPREIPDFWSCLNREEQETTTLAIAPVAASLLATWYQHLSLFSTRTVQEFQERLSEPLSWVSNPTRWLLNIPKPGCSSSWPEERFVWSQALMV